jgi:cell division protein FtsB
VSLDWLISNICVQLQAQQRYRAKRKAEFEELHATVNSLRRQIYELEHERYRRQNLEMELLQRGNRLMDTQPQVPHANASLLQAVLARSQNIIAPSIPESHPSSSTTVLVKQEAPETRICPSSLTIQAPPTSPERLKVLLDDYKAEVSRFALSHGLDHLPADGIGLSDALIARIQHMVKLGMELAGLVLNSSGTSGVDLLNHGTATTVPSIADDVSRWEMVCISVSLTSVQIENVIKWRDVVLNGLKQVYDHRIALKGKAIQTLEQEQSAGSQEGLSHWAEHLLLHAAGNCGYSLPALAAAELDEIVDCLRQNISHERSITLASLNELLHTIFSPVQALRYMYVSHPFSWNGLAFAHAVAKQNAGTQNK